MVVPARSPHCRVPTERLAYLLINISVKVLYVEKCLDLSKITRRTRRYTSVNATTKRSSLSFLSRPWARTLTSCTAAIILSLRASTILSKIHVLVSPLYFLESPRAIIQIVAISVPDVEQSLHVDVAVGVAALETSGLTSIRIQISDPDGYYSSHDDVKVWVMVVDFSILCV